MTDRITFAANVTAEGRNIRGSVVLKGSRTWRNNEWLEIDPAALVKADASDVIGLWDHDPGKVLGRTKNGTVVLNRTEDGIEYEIRNLPNTTAANDALEYVNGGYVNGSSFAIEGLKSVFTTDPDGTRVRRITSIKRLYDVSPTPDPAFANSSAAAFSKESTMTEPIVEEPKVPATPATPPAEPVKLSEPPKSGKDGWATFARDLSTEQIEAGMDQMFDASKGELKGELGDRYEGFSSELQRRRQEDAAQQSRIEQLKFRHAALRGQLKKAPEAEVFASDDYKAAFKRYLRGDLGALEQFAQSITGDGTQGGYTVPTDFRQKVTETQKAYGGIQSIAEVIETSDGRDLPWPTNDDTGNSAAIASEGSAVGSGGADLVFGQVSLGSFEYDATGASNLPLAVSKILIEDSAFDVEAFVARKLGERLGRKMAADYGNGTGTGEPFGLFAKTPDVMTATTMYAALVEHFFQVDQAYRDGGNCYWVLGDTILTKVFNSLDDNGRPLFQRNAEASGADAPAGFLLGKPVKLDQSAASNVAFGDIKAGFIIRRIKDIRLDVDPYTLISKRQIAFHAWARTDSAVQDSAAYSVSSYSGVSADS